MSGLTTHILDTSRGLPAPGVVVRLDESVKGEWQTRCQATTDADGRARLLSPDDDFLLGTYRLTFEVASYFEALATPAFYPEIQVVFCVRDARHHHVPLLLSAFGYSTYRGS